MATGAIRIADEYATANIKERIETILDNYLSFLEIMDGFEENLRYLIISGRKMAERRGRRGLGTRVQTSGSSDSTASAAADSVVPMEAVRSGDMGAELRGIECLEQYQRKVEVIHRMRDDHSLIRVQIKTLPWQDYRVLNSYLNGSHNLMKLTEEADCTYDGVKNQLKRARSRIRKLTAFHLERKYENN